MLRGRRISDFFHSDDVGWSITAQERGIDNTPTEEVLEGAERFAVTVLDPMVDAFGPPIANSWYRCAELNRVVGGHPRSYHLSGLALDFVPILSTMVDVMAWLETGAVPFDLAIYEFGRWIHVQAPRPGRSPRRRLLQTFEPGQYEEYSRQGLRAVA